MDNEDLVDTSPNLSLDQSSLPPLSIRLWEANGRQCGLCGKYLEIQHLTLDHVVPKVHGGKREGNLLPAHSWCNNQKGDRLPTEIELRRLIDNNARILY